MDNQYWTKFATWGTYLQQNGLRDGLFWLFKYMIPLLNYLYCENFCLSKHLQKLSSSIFIMLTCVSWKTVLVSIPDQASTGSNQVIDGFGWKDSVDGSFKRRLAKLNSKVRIWLFCNPLWFTFMGQVLLHLCQPCAVLYHRLWFESIPSTTSRLKFGIPNDN